MKENLNNNVENNNNNNLQDSLEKIIGNIGKNNKSFLEGFNGQKENIDKNYEKEKRNIVKETKEESKKLKQEIKEEKKSNEKFKSIELSQRDFINFAAMIVAEAKGEGERGMAAVGHAILNRVRLWGRSMNSILFQKDQYSPVTDGRLKKAKVNLTEQEKTFAKNILNGVIGNPIGVATFFQALTKEKGSRQSTAKTLTKPVIIGNHIFRSEKIYLKNSSKK